MRERLKKCPLCKSGLFLHHAEVTDHAISKEIFLLCKCSNCSLIFTNPRPDEDSIGEYYKSHEYISHQNQSNNFTNFLYKIVRLFTLRKKLAWINFFQPRPGNLLDIGCGTGHFLEKAKNAGWKVTGIEPNRVASNIAKEKGLAVLESLNALQQKEKFNVITLFHVLEHVHSLRKTGKLFRKILKRNGVLLIAVPNYNSFDSGFYKHNWASLDVPRHLYHFTKESMGFFAQEFDLEIIDEKPMVFDSYYVSILSERYKNYKQSNLLKYYHALKVGIKSNIQAHKNDKNYSSILFILKKK